MARRKWEMEEEDPCALQMGPMMDCTFLLLLYFVSVSTIDMMRMSKKVELPRAQQGIKEKDESGRFMVDIEWDESRYEATYKAGIYEISDPRDLEPLIRQGKQRGGKNFRVVVRADRRVPYEFTQPVMLAVAEAEVPNLMFSTKEPERTPE